MRNKLDFFRMLCYIKIQNKFKLGININKMNMNVAQFLFFTWWLWIQNPQPVFCCAYEKNIM